MLPVVKVKRVQEFVSDRFLAYLRTLFQHNSLQSKVSSGLSRHGDVVLDDECGRSFFRTPEVNILYLTGKKYQKL
jgi:hypothetical protein